MKKIFLLIILFSINFSFAAPLAIDAPERKQLIAMGYDIQKEDPGDTYTMADIGSTRIIFEKNEDRLAIYRVFNVQRKLSKDDEFELLKIMNKFNETYSYQFSLSKQSLTSTLYIFGNHDAKTFAKIVRLMDRVNALFDSEPKFFKLVNN
jgi:hypothetical protein